jgi:hypothetical protein
MLGFGLGTHHEAMNPTAHPEGETGFVGLNPSIFWEIQTKNSVPTSADTPFSFARTE